MTDELIYEVLHYGQRYFIHTAKGNISGLNQVIAEAISNADEAITRCAARDGAPDEGVIRISYDPDTHDLVAGDNGIGMTSSEMRKRLKDVGTEALEGARRGFFHRGIREVFTALGRSVVESVGLDDDGRALYSRAIFEPERNAMAFEFEDEPATDEIRARRGISNTGTLVRIPLARLALVKPGNFDFARMELQITNSVQVRPVIADPSRTVLFEYGAAPPRRLQFDYPEGETLVAQTELEIAGHRATLWTKAAPKALKNTGNSKQTRRNGILIRGERAAYEVSLGEKLKQNPGMQQVFGELRIDDIEAMQREADATADEAAQLIYKTDRSGLNTDHPFVEAIYAFLDERLGPLVSKLEQREEKKEMTPDMRRQLAKLAQLINKAVQSETFGELDTPSGDTKPERETSKPGPDEQPETPEEQPLPAIDGLGFSHSRVFINAGQQRIVKVWFDTVKIPPETPVVVESERDHIVRSAVLSDDQVPQHTSDEHGFAQLLLTINADNEEGRHEIEVAAGAYRATLTVHVRFPRASGFISQIVLDERDWESGSALRDAATGRVTVFVGRPEFKDAADRARRDKVKTPFEHPLYRELVVESVREAALRPAAQRLAEVEWDDLSPEDRADKDAFLNLVLTEYYALDYKLRAALLDAFLN
ncbi:MAG: hypothetical protein M3P18_14665 [Actinomycetota bacterium]|nr:hypothetical protein [Actinomycetota bacterium]